MEVAYFTLSDVNLDRLIGGEKAILPPPPTKLFVGGGGGGLPPPLFVRLCKNIPNVKVISSLW